MEILLIAYMIAGYWAVPRTIYKNKIVCTSYFNWVMSRLIWGTVLGFVLIPWAVLNEFRR